MKLSTPMPRCTMMCHGEKGGTGCVWEYAEGLEERDGLHLLEQGMTVSGWVTEYSCGAAAEFQPLHKCCC